MSADLGRSIEAHIRMFSDELARTSEPAARSMLRRLIFNLSLHLVLAAIRGRARSVAHPLRLAWRTASAAAPLNAWRWTAAFAMHQVRIRTRRLFA